MGEYVDRLGNAIRECFKCECAHTDSVPVRVPFPDKTVWEGIVEVFNLTGHAKSARCYAWAAEDEPATLVLHYPPVGSPHQAVQAAIAAERRARPI
jgi:hypothetical protein